MLRSDQADILIYMYVCTPIYMYVCIVRGFNDLVVAEIQSEQVDAAVEGRHVAHEAIRQVADTQSRAREQRHVVNSLHSRIWKRHTQNTL